MRKLIPLFMMILLILSSLGTADLLKNNNSSQKNIVGIDDGTEYWALLVGVSERMNKPWHDSNEPAISTMDLYNQLLKSDYWQSDHIRVLTGENASWLNIFRGLKWLDEMDDEDDICLFYIATHGGQCSDAFPKDEEDGLDEFLIAYDTDRIYFPGIGLTIHIPHRLFYLYDDDINYMLSQLDAKGVCAIIDTCFSGGFNDHPKNNEINQEFYDILCNSNPISSSNWNKGFAEDIAGSGRVVLAASAEDKLSQSYGFIHYLIEGLQGFGDADSDNKCSAEEAFNYAAPRYEEFCSREMDFLATPEIYDDYPGELQLTSNEFPPYPTTYIGQLIGDINIEYTYTFSSQDPEEDQIGYYVDWGDGTEEFTALYLSGEPVDLSHHWDIPGTYNIWFDSKDEHGAIKYWQTGHPDHFTVIIKDEKFADQKQTKTYIDQCFNDGLISNEIWIAQSFVPDTSILSQVDLEAMVSAVYSEPGPLHVSIRSDLKGEDLTDVSVMPQQFNNHMIPEAPRSKWTTFDFPDIGVTVGDTYYIVCRFDESCIGCVNYAGVGYYDDPDYIDDPYPNGNVFISKNQGGYWKEYSTILDFCFVTYGR